MNSTRIDQSETGIRPIHIGIILLALAAALIHLSLLFPDLLFILNGLGYLALLAAYFLPIAFLRENRDLVRWAFMGYTLITILAWVVIGERTLLGWTTAAIEVLLIVLLWLDGRRQVSRL